MNSPYTLQPIDALMAAQTSVGLTLTALLWARPLRPRVATLVMLLAIWVAVVSPIDVEYFRSFGFTTAPDHTERVVRLAAVLAALSCVLTGRVLLSVVGLVCAAAIWRIRGYITAADHDIAALDLAAIGLLVGIHYRTLEPRAEVARAPAGRPRFLRDDAVLFVIAATLSAVVANYVLGRHTNSGDEWANTYQAALFAKLRAFDTVPPCSEAFRSFWVFQYVGRSFAQFTPGWPLFMAPFVATNVVWLATPCALGLLAVGVARLSRRAAAGFTAGTAAPQIGEVRAAGLLGGLAVTLGSTMLINGASRYPHVFVAAMFAWCTETLFVVADRELDHTAQWCWGSVLGTAAALLLAARPADGATLGVGLLVYFVYAVARRRIGLRALAGIVISFAFWGSLCLVILRLQLGQWGKTGYSLTGTFYPWFDVHWRRPEADEVFLSIPLAAGSYCWWPCSPAVGLAGLMVLRGRGRRVAFALVTGLAPLLALYMLRDGGKGSSAFGYGPRYQFPAVVPMAVGFGTLLSQLWRMGGARNHVRSALAQGGPAALALSAAALGVIRVAPLVYPYTRSEVQLHNRLNDAIATAKLQNAIVLADDGISNTDPRDLPENLPLDLYPDQDVLIAVDSSHEMQRCVKEHFPDRDLYHARSLGLTVRIQPE